MLHTDGIPFADEACTWMLDAVPLPTQTIRRPQTLRCGSFCVEGSGKHVTHMHEWIARNHRHVIQARCQLTSRPSLNPVPFRPCTYLEVQACWYLCSVRTTSLLQGLSIGVAGAETSMRSHG